MNDYWKSLTSYLMHMNIHVRELYFVKTCFDKQSKAILPLKILSFSKNKLVHFTNGNMKIWQALHYNS